MKSDNNKAKILGVGVATMDIYVNQGRMYPGGNEYNIASHAVKCGADAGFLGVFADDKAGELLEKTLIDIGVESNKSHHEHGCSGYSLVELKDDGDRVFLSWNQEGVTDLYPIQFNDDEIEYIKKFDVCCLGRCASVSFEKIKLLSEQGIDICYDFHAVYDEELIKKMAPLVKYAFFSASHLNENETKEVLECAVLNGCKIAVGTRGEEKFYAYDGEDFYEQEPFKTKAIDALGAGDSFIAAFLTSYITNTKMGLLNNKDKMKEALIDAAAHAAKVVKLGGSLGICYDIDIDRINDVLSVRG